MENNQITQTISHGEVVLPPLNGRATITGATGNILKFCGDSCSRRLDGPDMPMPATPLDIREIIREGTILEAFLSSAPELSDLMLTKHQIIYFCAMHKNWLCCGPEKNFFLTLPAWSQKWPRFIRNLKPWKKFYRAASVHVDQEGNIGIDFRRLDSIIKVSGTKHCRIIVPMEAR